MASAKRVGEPEIELRLTMDEAETLAKIMYNVGGHARYSRRRHVDAIRKALDTASVARAGEMSGSLEFITEGNPV